MSEVAIQPTTDELTQPSTQPLPIVDGKPDHAALLEAALTMPGSLGNTYRRFYNYSARNCVLLYMQGAREPMATMKRWNELEHRVVKGSRAYQIMRPIFGKEEVEPGVQEEVLRGFKLVKCLFAASQTVGPELPPVEPRIWDKAKALGELGLTEVPFDNVDGNLQGWSDGKNVAINPVAVYPFKTLVHEIAHCVIGHGDKDYDYQAHRGIAEFQAEGTAYVVMNELDLQEHMNMGESRDYMQRWLRNQRPEDGDIRPVFGAVDKILKAGLVEA